MPVRSHLLKVFVQTPSSDAACPILNHELMKQHHDLENITPNDITMSSLPSGNSHLQECPSFTRLMIYLFFLYHCL
ncbi:MAG: hypothetical protein ACXQS8_01515 [Candidatus Helarchaeales archaeon]